MEIEAVTEDNRPSKSRWQTRWGHPHITYDYGVDMGSLHVLDRLVRIACKPWQDGTFGPRTGQGQLIDHTSRYLDGEEEREGIYR